MLGFCACGCWIFGGSLKFGAFVLSGCAGALSATPKLMISTILLTSFLTLSGKDEGRSFPVNFRLQRYIASANSGNNSCPDFVVSESVHICAKLLPSSLLRSSKSFALSPLRACSLAPVALLKSCSNLAWSCAVMKERRTLGILAPLGFEEEGGGGIDAGEPRKELAMSLLVSPVG